MLYGPKAAGKGRVVHQGGAGTHHDGVALGPQLVDRHGGERGGKPGRPLALIFTQAVDETVLALGPFQDDVGAMAQVIAEKAPVEPPAGLLFDPYHGVDTGLLQFLQAFAADGGKGVEAADHYAGDPLFNNQIGAGRCLAVVGAGLERDV